MSVGDVDAKTHLTCAQCRFPVTSAMEMRGTLEDGQSNDVLRNLVAARTGRYHVEGGERTNSSWLAEFQAAFSNTEAAQNLTTFDKIVLPLGKYERSQWLRVR